MTHDIRRRDVATQARTETAMHQILPRFLCALLAVVVIAYLVTNSAFAFGRVRAIQRSAVVAGEYAGKYFGKLLHGDPIHSSGKVQPASDRHPPNDSFFYFSNPPP